jgi:nucleoporin NUP2
VGFGFGSPPKTPPAAAESSSKSGFTFGSSFQAPSSSTSSAVNEGSGPTTGEEGEEVDHAKILSPVSVHDREGEGEEDEDTTHSVKCKVYKLNKEEGGAGWSDMGIGERSTCLPSETAIEFHQGILRVKQHKDTGSRRILLRNSSTGKLVIVSLSSIMESHLDPNYDRISTSIRE